MFQYVPTCSISWLRFEKKDQPTYQLIIQPIHQATNQATNHPTKQLIILTNPTQPNPTQPNQPPLKPQNCLVTSCNHKESDGLDLRQNYFTILSAVLESPGFHEDSAGENAGGYQNRGPLKQGNCRYGYMMIYR